MAVSYTKLWKLLLDKKMKRTDLKIIFGISSSTLAKLGKDEYVSLESIDKICCSLDCNVGDIIDIVKVE
ncbi:Cro/Cl family transcriptional regulator [Clostridiales bacterium COT073_COT-073]|nr:Cro/Cl family transcriptional regulator [Clostridiales bacterium COT073_COT-073]